MLCHAINMESITEVFLCRMKLQTGTHCHPEKHPQVLAAPQLALVEAVRQGKHNTVTSTTFGSQEIVQDSGIPSQEDDFHMQSSLKHVDVLILYRGGEEGGVLERSP